MSGHLEQAAGAFNAAGQQMPVELVVSASGQIDTAVAAIQQAGGAVGDELTGIALAIKGELDATAARLQQLTARQCRASCDAARVLRMDGQR